MRSRLVALLSASALALPALALSAPAASAAPTDISSSAGTSVVQTPTSDWGSGYCANVTVSTDSTSPVTWQVTLPLTASVNNIWDAQTVGQAPSGATQAVGVSYDSTVVAAAPVTFGYCASVTSPPSPLQPGLIPQFASPNATSSSFSVEMVNYDPAYSYSSSATNGTASQSGDMFTVSGLTPGQTSTLTVTTSRSGYQDGVGTLTDTASSAPDSPMILTFAAPVSTVAGFTAQITNYDCAPGATFTCAFTTTAGTVSQAGGVVTVSGLQPLQSATVTATTTAAGYPQGTSSVTGQATDGTQPAPTLVFATPTPNSSGFTAVVANPALCASSAATSCAFSSTAGSAVFNAATSQVTVTGLTAGQAATLTGTVSGSALAPTSTSVTGHAAGASSSMLVGPYADMGLWPPTNLSSVMTSTGASFITPAFVMHGTAACVPTWAGYDAYTIPGASDNASDLAAAQAAGGTVAVSFGGLNEHELAETCTDTTQLQAAYNTVATTFNTNILDFDIEGGALSDRAQNQRRAAALAALQQQWAAAGKSLHVTLTLATTTTGLDAYGQITVQEFLAAGVSVSRINLMVMDYGPSFTGDMAEYAITAAEGLEAWMATQPAWAGLTDQQLGAYVGLIPMIGQNDVAGEVFTLSDATDLSNWAVANGISMIGWWEATRDQSCASASSPLYTCSGVTQTPWQFGKTFTSIAG